MTDALPVLYHQIDMRVRSITDEHPGWPCRKGCDSCCRHLAASPQLSRAEWEVLRQGLLRLPAETLQEIGSRLSQHPICPLLDRPSGACLVYDHRPAACRTYGFYRERDQGLYCKQIEAMVDRGECDQVVWGNAASVTAALAESAPLEEWWTQWSGTAPFTDSSSLAGS